MFQAHRASLTGVYFYCGFSIHSSGNFTSPSDDYIQSHTAPFRELGLDVGVALATDQAAIESGRAAAGIPAAVEAAVKHRLTSLMVDYEPSTNITHAHSEAYAKFIAELSTALHKKGLQCGMCVSSWGILTTFDLFHQSGVDQMMSMASTYYGKNVTSDQGWLQKELDQKVSLEQLHVGIGSTNSITQAWDYQWDEPKFKTFMAFLRQKKIRGVDLWRTDIDTLNATNGTAPWIYDSLASFLAEPLY